MTTMMIIVISTIWWLGGNKGIHIPYIPPEMHRELAGAANRLSEPHDNLVG